MSKVYILSSHCGQWSDYQMWNVSAYLFEVQANKECDRLNKLVNRGLKAVKKAEERLYRNKGVGPNLGSVKHYTRYNETVNKIYKILEKMGVTDTDHCRYTVEEIELIVGE